MYKKEGRGLLGLREREKVQVVGFCFASRASASWPDRERRNSSRSHS